MLGLSQRPVKSSIVLKSCCVLSEKMTSDQSVPQLVLDGPGHSDEDQEVPDPMGLPQRPNLDQQPRRRANSDPLERVAQHVLHLSSNNEQPLDLSQTNRRQQGNGPPMVPIINNRPSNYHGQVQQIGLVQLVNIINEQVNVVQQFMHMSLHDEQPLDLSQGNRPQRANCGININGNNGPANNHDQVNNIGPQRENDNEPLVQGSNNGPQQAGGQVNINGPINNGQSNNHGIDCNYNPQPAHAAQPRLNVSLHDEQPLDLSQGSTQQQAMGHININRPARPANNQDQADNIGPQQRNTNRPLVQRNRHNQSVPSNKASNVANQLQSNASRTYLDINDTLIVRDRLAEARRHLSVSLRCGFCNRSPAPGQAIFGCPDRHIICQPCLALGPDNLGLVWCPACPVQLSRWCILHRLRVHERIIVLATQRDISYESFRTKALKELECPVCYDMPRVEAILCTNGHRLCSRCYTKVPKCPVCRARYLALEFDDLVDLLHGLACFLSL